MHTWCAPANKQLTSKSQKVENMSCERRAERAPKVKRATVCGATHVFRPYAIDVSCEACTTMWHYRMCDEVGQLGTGPPLSTYKVV